MSMSNILTLALRMHQGKPVRVPALSKSDFNNLLDALTTLRKELAV